MQPKPAGPHLVKIASLQLIGFERTGKIAQAKAQLQLVGLEMQLDRPAHRALVGVANHVCAGLVNAEHEKVMIGGNFLAAFLEEGAHEATDLAKLARIAAEGQMQPHEARNR